MEDLLLYVAQIGVFTFSFLLFLRNLDESLVKRRIKQVKLPKIVTAYVFFVSLGLVFAEFFVLFNVFALFSYDLDFEISKKLKTKRIERAVLGVVHRTILNISSGKSFQNAYFLSISDVEPYLKSNFELFWELNNTPKESFPGPRSYHLFQILRDCRKNSAKSSQVLDNFKKSLQMENRFTRKVSVALSQIRAQIGFIAAFYIILLVVQVHMGNIQLFSGPIYLSIALLLIGSLAVYCLPRSFKWSQ